MKNRYLLQLKHFINYVKTNNKPLTDGEQGARVVKILEEIEAKLK